MELMRLEDIVKSADDRLLDETTAQVRKDFSFERLELSDRSIDTYADLFEELRDRIVEIIRHDEQALYRLLYRIDIPDRIIQARLENSVDMDADAILAELILSREYQKVVIRKQFSC